MAEYAWRPLGELLVKHGLIDDYQLESLLLEQLLTGQLFGELLVARRIVSPVEMAAIVAEQHGLHLEPEHRPAPPPDGASPAASREGRWRPLGRILVDKEVLTESGLQRVLLAQRRRGGLLGQLLVERGYVTPAQLAEAVAEQHGLDVPSETLATAESRPAEPSGDTVYEVRMPGTTSEKPLHVSSSFLDASDFAFELLDSEDPDALEVIRVDRDRHEVAWSYTRPVAEHATTSWV